MRRTRRESKVRKGYKIGEVGVMVGLPCSVLRFWESEFPILKPYKTKGGQRLYSDADVSTIRQIKQLLYEEKFTIPGARKELERRASESPQLEPSAHDPLVPARAAISRIRQSLKELLAFVAKGATDAGS